MIEIYVRALGTAQALVPTPESREAFTDEVKPGEVYTCRLTTLKGRNSGFHRKLFALLRILHGYHLQQDNVIRDFDTFRLWATMSAGYFEVSPDKGQLLPRSLKFSKMDPDEFERLFNALIDWGIKAFVPSTVMASDIENEVALTLLGFT